jgi:hypothetical protein
MVRMGSPAKDKGVTDMMFHALAGLGQCDDGTYDCLTPTGDTTPSDIAGSNSVDTSYNPYPVSAYPPASGTAISTPTGSASTGFNWGVFGSLFGVAAADTTKVLTSSNTTAQVQAQTAAQIAASQAAAVSSSASSSTMMYLGIAAVAGVLLVSVMKKGH